MARAAGEPPDAADWRARYAAALDAAERAAGSAREEGRAVACGFTGNVDRVAVLDGPRLAALLEGSSASPGGERVVRAGSVEEVLAGVVQCVRAGSGTDLPVADPAVQQWLLDRAPGRSQVGGTGAQAAVTLDRLGFPALLHLTGRAPEQIAALGEGRHLAIAAAGGILPAARAARPADPVMWHVALEFPAGTPIPAAAGGGAAPAGDRVIVSHDPVNADFRIDPAFVEAVAAAGERVPAVLISGFSQVVDPDRLERVLADAALALREWKRGNPGLLVHLELGAMPRPGMLHGVLDALAPLVSSIGLNEDELRDLADPSRDAPRFGWAERSEALLSIAGRWPVHRIGLHTRRGCVSITGGDPEVERTALLFASLVAAARVATGGFPDLRICRDVLASSEIGPVPPVAEGAAPVGRVVSAPALRTSRSAASVGLGDSFTGALLAMLAHAPGTP